MKLKIDYCVFKANKNLKKELKDFNDRAAEEEDLIVKSLVSDEIRAMLKMLDIKIEDCDEATLAYVKSVVKNNL